MNSKNDLFRKKLRSYIQINYFMAIMDAVGLANQILIKKMPTLSRADQKFSEELFVAVSICLATDDENSTLGDMVDSVTKYSCAAQERFDNLLDRYKHLKLDYEVRMWMEKWSANAANCYRPDDLARVLKNISDHWSSSIIEKMQSNADESRAKPNKRAVQIFDPNRLNEAEARLEELSEEKSKAGLSVLRKARHNNGYRQVPLFRKAFKNLEETARQFENLKEPIDRLKIDLILASEMSLDEFYVKPLLLLGPPGVGKTYLTYQLADSLSVESTKFSAGGLDGGFQLCGSHPSWSHAKYGDMFELLAKSEYSTQVVVLDEVDKLSQSKSNPVLPVLLDLLERRTAMNFNDEFLEMEFDCSKCIFILTANNIEDVPLPLLSRVNVFEIPRPDKEQRFRIIQSEIEYLHKKTRLRRIQFDESQCLMLADRADLDLRKTTDIVREAFARAISLKINQATFNVPVSKVKSIGFGIR
jgi:ATP-dependent Lon protease